MYGQINQFSSLPCYRDVGRVRREKTLLEWMVTLLSTSKKVIKAEDGLFVIKKGMLIGDRNRQCKSQL